MNGLLLDGKQTITKQKTKSVVENRQLLHKRALLIACFNSSQQDEKKTQ